MDRNINSSVERLIRHTDNGFKSLHPRAIWQARTILFFLARRDVLVSYKQTMLGVFWNLLKPIITALIFVFVFERLGDFPDYDLPYFLIAMAGLLVWEFFANSINWGTLSFINDREIITKVNFPRALIPFVASFRNTIGFGINLLVIILSMIYFNIPITFNLLLVPLIFVLIVTVNFGLNLWLSTINVFYRDIQALIPFILRAGLFLSPIGFTLKSIPNEWVWLYSINPMVYLIELMRFSILGNSFAMEPKVWITGLISTIVLLAGGLWLFAKKERKFADII